MMNHRTRLVLIGLMAATVPLEPQPTKGTPVMQPLAPPPPKPRPPGERHPTEPAFTPIHRPPPRLPRPKQRENLKAADRRRKRMESTVMKHATPLPNRWVMDEEARARLLKSGISAEFIDATLANATPPSLLGNKGFFVVDDYGDVPPEVWGDLAPTEPEAKDSCEASRADRQDLASCRAMCAWKGGGPCLESDCPRRVTP